MVRAGGWMPRWASAALAYLPTGTCSPAMARLSTVFRSKLATSFRTTQARRFDSQSWRSINFSWSSHSGAAVMKRSAGAPAWICRARVGDASNWRFTSRPVFFFQSSAISVKRSYRLDAARMVTEVDAGEVAAAELAGPGSARAAVDGLSALHAVAARRRQAAAAAVRFISEAS